MEQGVPCIQEYCYQDRFGLKVKLPNGNVALRVLPVRIHDLDANDKALLESELGPLRPLDFIFSAPGVNRPLTSTDNPDKNLNKTFYRDQINKVANAVKEVIGAMGRGDGQVPQPSGQLWDFSFEGLKVKRRVRLVAGTVVLLAAVLLYLYRDTIFTKFPDEKK